MGKSKDLATGNSAAYVETAGDTMTGNLGIGASPSIPLQVEKAGGGNFVASFQNTTSGTPYGVHVKDASSGSNGYPLLQVTNSAGSSTYFRVDSGTGIVTNPNNPWFSAHGTGGWVTFANAGSDNILNVFNGGTVYQNTGGGFNTSTSSYTAPVSGRYCFLYNTYTKGGASTSAGQYLYPRLYVNNTPTQPRENIKHYNGENYDEGREMTIMFNLAANDVVKCGCWSSHTTNQYYGASFHWQGFLIG